MPFGAGSSVDDPILKYFKIRKHRFLWAWGFILAGLLGSYYIHTYILAICIAGILLPWWPHRVKLPEDAFGDRSDFVEGGARIGGTICFHDGEECKISFNKSAHGLIGQQQFIELNAKNGTLILTPNTYWARLGKKYITGSLTDISVKSTTGRTSKTWTHVRKDGEPDNRYKDNSEMTLIHSWLLHIVLTEELSWRLEFFSKPTSNSVEENLLILIGEKQANDDSDRQKSDEDESSAIQNVYRITATEFLDSLNEVTEFANPTAFKDYVNAVDQSEFERIFANTVAILCGTRLDASRSQQIVAFSSYLKGNYGEPVALAIGRKDAFAKLFSLNG
jgi:hypothetical protein